jgi:hypothetical protein
MREPAPGRHGLPWRYESAVSSRSHILSARESGPSRICLGRPQNPQRSRVACLLASCRGDSAYAHASPHHAEVSPLSGVARCLLSARLQRGVCFLRDPLPASRSHILRRAYLVNPSRRPTGLPSSTTMTWREGVLPIHRRCRVSVPEYVSQASETACRFGPGDRSYLRLSYVTMVTAVHLSSPDRQA